MCVVCYLIVALVFIPLTVSDVEHLFMRLLVFLYLLGEKSVQVLCAFFPLGGVAVVEWTYLLSSDEQRFLSRELAELDPDCRNIGLAVRKTDWRIETQPRAPSKLAVQDPVEK